MQNFVVFALVVELELLEDARSVRREAQVVRDLDGGLRIFALLRGFDLVKLAHQFIVKNVDSIARDFKRALKPVFEL